MQVNACIVFPVHDDFRLFETLVSLNWLVFTKEKSKKHLGKKPYQKETSEASQENLCEINID